MERHPSLVIDHSTGDRPRHAMNRSSKPWSAERAGRDQGILAYAIPLADLVRPANALIAGSVVLPSLSLMVTRSFAAWMRAGDTCSGLAASGAGRLLVAVI